jgi:peptide/nickel transport system substrate-binding protein
METERPGENRLSLFGDSAKVTREEVLRRGAAAGLLFGAGSLGFIGSACSGSDSEADAVTSETEAVTRGGTLRHGSTAGLGATVLDAHTVFGWSNDARIMNLYDHLVVWDRERSVLQPDLAEEFTAEAADTWLIRLKQGIEFHNGKTLDIDDVIFTFQRIIDPKTAAVSASTLASVDPNGFTKLDDYTVRLKLKRPDVTIADAMSEFSAGVVPVGFDPNNPVGTGPFKFKSFTSGESSDFLRNENFWKEGLPYVDELVIIDFPDDSARVNALISGQVDIIDHVPLGQAPVIEGNDDLAILDEKGGGQWLPIVMRVDAPPFDNNDVRLAMRLIADRGEMVEQALAGFGRPGNDIFAPLDACYNSSLPQREQDLDQAKSLLKRAGQENLKVDLVTSNPAAGMVEAAQVFAEQAREAGVTIKVQVVDVPTLFGPEYTTRPFGMNFWGPRSFLIQAAQNMLPTSAENNTHWPDAESKEYVSLYQEALGTLDEQQRCELINEMQEMEWNRGGHIVWGFSNLVGAFNTKVKGVVPGKNFPLNNFTHETLSIS